MLQRKSIIIHFDKPKFLKSIDKGILNIYYVSEKNNYAVAYFDITREKQVKKHLEKFNEITSIEDSLLEVENITF